MVNQRDEIVATLGLCETEAARLSQSDSGLPGLLGELRVFHAGANLGEVMRRPLSDGRSALDILLTQGGCKAQGAIRYDGFAHAGPFEAFTASGQIDIHQLSHELGIPLSVLANAFRSATNQVLEHPEKMLIQWKATELLGAMNQLAAHTTDKQYALWWLGTPQSEFGGGTPIELMNEGHLDLVVGLISDLYFMVPD